MTEPNLLSVPQEAAFTPEEENIVKARLFAMLSKQAKLRTQGDHSSLREEDAAELLESLLFTLRYQLFLQGQSLQTMLTADLGGMLKQGQAALRHCLSSAETLYRIALKKTVTFGNLALQDTLRGIGQFFQSYDLILYAHRIPASIDYQLCLPVEDHLRGVLYIQAYLERLLTENALLIQLPRDRVEALLRRASPDYGDLLLNLYEPVAACTVGLAILGCDVWMLEVSQAQALEVYRLLSSLPSGAAKDRLGQAADSVCRSLQITGTQPRGYLRQASLSLYPRVIQSPQSTCGVFSASM